MRILFALLLVVGGFGLSACTNTYHGAGKDVENAGEEMQDQFN